MDRKSKSLISKVRSKLEEMLLYNITIVIYSIAGQTKESLLELVIKERQRDRERNVLLYIDVRAHALFL